MTRPPPYRQSAIDVPHGENIVLPGHHSHHPPRAALPLRVHLLPVLYMQTFHDDVVQTSF